VPGRPRSFRFGLGLSIHLNNRVDTKEHPPPPPPPLKISVADVGAKFIRSGLIGPVFDSGVLILLYESYILNGPALQLENKKNTTNQTFGLPLCLHD
jgi:hypothetical protein